ncbi:MAG: PEGA domain-containing protein [Myxococcales bacterium]|nr:PEGA domain-containing protein [Myxococcales bacterium]
MTGLMTLALALLLAAPAPRTATAEAPTPAQVAEARDLYRAGGQAYAQGRYETAIELFEQARARVKRAPILFSLAQAYRLQYFVDGEADRLERAVALYRAYLAAVPDGGRQDHATQHLATLTPILDRLQREAAGEQQRARIIVSSPQDEAVALLDPQAEPVALPATFSVEAGTYEITVRAAGFAPASQRTQAVAGGVASLSFDLTPLPASLTVQAPTGARIAVDGSVLGEAPLPGPVTVPAGPHTVAVLARGRDAFVAPVELGRGEAATVQATLETSRQRVLAWITLGLGAALSAGAVTAGVLAWDREGDADDLAARYDTAGLSVAEVRAYNRALADRDAFNDAALGLGLAGGLTLAAGLGLYLFDEPEAPRPLVLPGGVGMAGRF